MSTQTIPKVRVTRAGVQPDAAVVDSSQGSGLTLLTNDGNIIIFVENPGIVDATLEVVPQQSYGGLVLPNQILDIPAGATRAFGPWPPALFNDDRGSVQIVTGAAVVNVYALGI